MCISFQKMILNSSFCVCVFSVTDFRAKSEVKRHQCEDAVHIRSYKMSTLQLEAQSANENITIFLPVALKHSKVCQHHLPGSSERILFMYVCTYSI